MTLLLNVFDYFIIIKYCNTFLGERRRISRLFFGLHSAMMIWLGMYINSFGVPIYNLIVSAAIIFFTGLLYSEKWMLKLGFGFAYIGLGAVAEIIVFNFADREYLEKNIIYSYLMITICQLIKYLLILFVGKLKRAKNESLSFETLSLIVLILFNGTFACITLNWYSFNDKENTGMMVKLIIVIIFLFIFVFMFHLIEKINIITRLNYEQEMTIQESILKETYYKEIDANNQQLNKIKHNFKNQLFTLSELTEHDINAARETINNMFDEINLIENKIYTNNNALNAICKVKFAYARSRNIKIDSKINLPNSINLTYGEMGILYGNLLDNAIEANEKVDVKYRKIQFMTQLYNDNLLVSIENPKDKHAVLEGGYQTTKKDKKSHGFGIKSVKEIVEKYNGTFIVYEEDEIFKVEAVLYGIVEVIR